jgi:energy-coupling factor transporter ATP-binding protein EcfA2
VTRIKEFVEIHSGYASAVDVRTEFIDPEKNFERITRYVPIKAHRDAIERIMMALRPKDKRFYFLTGNYGTGKSHLCLMIANLFSNKSNSSELEGFFTNYAKVDEPKAKELRALRKEGRHLVAICDFGNKDDFEEVVLQAIAQACEREEVSYFMDTHFNEALRKIDSWQKAEKQQKRLPKLPAFIQELQEKHPEYTLKKLMEGLKDYREEAMTIFKEIYKNVLDTEFTYERSNLVEILRDLLSSPKFKEKYAGLLVIFDEFGYTLKDRRISLQIIQSFAQLCAQGWKEAGKSTAPVVFLATGHKTFKDYSKPEDKADFDKIADRVEEIGLTPEGMEKIIGAIVVPNRKSEIWTKEVAPNIDVFNTLIPECKRIGIFDKLDAATLREEILEKIYPMHPMATYCLLKLASEVGSNNRTVFTFFSGEFTAEDQSYPFYVNYNDVLDSQDCLNLYSTDLLFTYFKDNLTSTNKELKESTRKILMNYEASIRELNKVAKSIDIEGDKTAERILKVMLVNEIIGIKNDLENVVFALYPKSAREKAVVKVTVEKLHEAKVLFYNGISDAYEFRRSEAVDFDTAIEVYKKDTTNYPQNIAQAVDAAITFTRDDVYLEAKGYNALYNEDKRFKRKLVTIADLEQTEKQEGVNVNLFNALQRQLEAPMDWKDSFEGWILCVLCQTPEEINKAKKSAAKNTSNRVLAVIPKSPTDWIDLLLDFNAVKSIGCSNDYETFSTQDKSRLKDLVDAALKRLILAKTEAIEGRNSIWYTDQGKILLDKITNPSDATDKCLETLFGKRNRLKHIDLNLSHAAKFQPNKNIALKDAVNRILSPKWDIEVDSSYSNDKGEIRYLKNTLASQGVLKQTGRPEGSIYRYQIEPDPSKFSQVFPALADMMSQIKIQETTGIRIKEDVIRKYSSPPYGLGPISLSIFLSIVLKMYGDSVRLRKEQTEIGDIGIKDFDVIYGLIEGNYPNALLAYRQISRTERDFLNQLFDVFSLGTPQKIGDRSVFETYNSLKLWWDSLPTVSKSSIYDTKLLPTIPKLIDAFNNISETVAHDFVFGKVQEIYDYDFNELITEEKAKDILTKLKTDRKYIDEGFDCLKSKIQIETKQIFSIEGNTLEDLRLGIRNWYNSLDSNQRDLDATWHTSESKVLIRRLGQVLDISDTLFVSIPEDPGFGLKAIKDWTSDKSQDYIQKIRIGKEHIEQNRIKVDPPVWQVTSPNKYRIEENKKGANINYRVSAKLVIKPPTKDTVVYATSNGEDPWDDKSQRSEMKPETTLDADGGNKRFRLITGDKEGNWSKETEINFIDQEKKHEIRVETGFGKAETIVQFVFPLDEQSFKTSIQSLVNESLEHRVVDKKAVKKILTELLKETEK